MEPKQIEKIKELMDQIDLNSFNQSLIKDNKIVFIVEDRIYRCVMPSQKILAMAEELENRLKIEFLQKDGYVTRKKLKEILKEKQGVDIDALEKEKENLQSKLKDVYLDLAILTTSDEEQINELKNKKKKIEEDFTRVIIDIVDYMKPCIEEQIRKKYYEYLTHLCTEKNVQGEEWKRVWDNLGEYENDNSKLAHTAVGFLQTLLLNVRD